MPPIRTPTRRAALGQLNGPRRVAAQQVAAAALATIAVDWSATARCFWRRGWFWVYIYIYQILRPFSFRFSELLNWRSSVDYSNKNRQTASNRMLIYDPFGNSAAFCKCEAGEYWLWSTWKWREAASFQLRDYWSTFTWDCSRGELQNHIYLVLSNVKFDRNLLRFMSCLLLIYYLSSKSRTPYIWPPIKRQTTKEAFHRFIPET